MNMHFLSTALEFKCYVYAPESCRIKSGKIIQDNDARSWTNGFLTENICIQKFLYVCLLLNY